VWKTFRIVTGSLQRVAAGPARISGGLHQARRQVAEKDKTGMPPKRGSKAYRDHQRECLARRGVGGRQLVEQLVTELIRCGNRPREAWRLTLRIHSDLAG
jgi:hypothetical protein